MWSDSISRSHSAVTITMQMRFRWDCGRSLRICARKTLQRTKRVMPLAPQGLKATTLQMIYHEYRLHRQASVYRPFRRPLAPFLATWQRFFHIQAFRDSLLVYHPMVLLLSPCLQCTRGQFIAHQILAILHQVPTLLARQHYHHMQLQLM